MLYLRTISRVFEHHNIISIQWDVTLYLTLMKILRNEYAYPFRRMSHIPDLPLIKWAYTAATAAGPPAG